MDLPLVRNNARVVLARGYDGALHLGMTLAAEAKFFLRALTATAATAIGSALKACTGHYADALTLEALVLVPRANSTWCATAVIATRFAHAIWSALARPLQAESILNQVARFQVRQLLPLATLFWSASTNCTRVPIITVLGKKEEAITPAAVVANGASVAVAAPCRCRRVEAAQKGVATVGRTWVGVITRQQGEGSAIAPDAMVSLSTLIAVIAIGLIGFERTAKPLYTVVVGAHIIVVAREWL